MGVQGGEDKMSEKYTDLNVLEWHNRYKIIKSFIKVAEEFSVDRDTIHSRFKALKL